MPFNGLLVVVAALIGASLVQGQGILWQQHVDTAVYNAAGISRLGYVVAGTWLNEPEVAEIFDLETGNKTVKSIGDSNPQDNALFDIDISEMNSVAVASRVSQGNFTSILYKWNAASPSPNPDWTASLDKTSIIGMDVSGDGSLIGVAAYVNVSYFQPPVYQVLFIDGQSGQEHVEYRYTGKQGELGASIVLSDNGMYAALLTAQGNVVVLTVLHLPSHQNHSQPAADFEINHAYGQAFSMSGDGMYVAAGQADTLAVWKRDDSKTQLTYVPLFTFNTPSNTYFVESNSISFASGAEILAVGWINIQVPAGQNRVTAFRLPSATPIFDFTAPPGSGQYQNMVSGVRVSESGKYIAVSSWGNAAPLPGTQQVQVFSITNTTAPVYALFTPGSMFDVAITETSQHGVVVVAAGKHVHANVMGNGGDLFVAQVEKSTVPAAIDLKIAATVNHARAGWTAGVNKRFAGVSLRDAAKMMGTHLRHNKPQHVPRPVHANISAPPAAFDARTAWPGCVGPIRDQQQCGSCWAFGAVESFSDRLCIKGGKRQYVELSPEYVIDCDNKDGGCGGGWLAYAWEFLTVSGTVPDACKPYVSGQGTAPPCSSHCSSTNGTFHRYNVKQGSTVELVTELDIQQAILANGPVEAAFSVYADFMNYKTGVYTHTTGIFLGGHAIKLLGWGVVDSTPYWIAANSWGATWGGMGGYFYIRRGTDECYLESNAIAGVPNV